MEVRVRAQSYMLPVILLVSLFFNQSAFSEKKNREYGEEARREIKNYNDDYDEQPAEGNSDIMPCSNRIRKMDDYREHNRKKNGAAVNGSGKSSGKNQQGYVCYIVKNGDTLFSIAKRSGTSVKKIQEINNFDQTTRIFKGMKLRIPSGKQSVIAAGESGKNRNISSGTVSDSQKPIFSWPLKKVSSFSRDGKDGVRPIGLIIKGKPGSDVFASENGVVKRVGYMRGYGKYIVVKHGKSYITVYSNLMNVDVKNGDTVLKGGRIGNISSDMTLHFQIDREGKPENPLNLLPARS